MWSIVRSAFAFTLLSLLACVPALAESRVPVVTVPTDDPMMRVAFARARATLDDFLAKLAHPPAGTHHYAVKIGIQDAPEGGFMIMGPGQRDRTEYFWIGDIEDDEDGFTGFVHNDPVSVRNISMNQKIHFSRRDIADWTYFEGRKMKGNFTACPALAHSPEALAEMHEMLGLTCELAAP
jgi:uncharacterized protein YegJ (DUF2314 family)